MSIKYSNQAKKNINLFYKSYQDINFYIEDEKRETEHAYKIILNKVFDGEFKVTRVFPLGNKTKVIDAAKKNTSKNNFYIVDRDLDPYLDNYLDPKTINNVIELERYCFENYLIEKKSFDETMGFYVSPDKIESEYEKWISEVIIDFEKIFRVAIVSRKYNLKSCITDKEYSYLINNTYQLCEKKVEELYEEKKIDVEKEGQDFNVELKLVEDKLNGVDIKNQLVSGKFLWASLTNYCKKTAKETGDGKGMIDKALFISFVQSIDLKNFDFLKRRVL